MGPATPRVHQRVAAVVVALTGKPERASCGAAYAAIMVAVQAWHTPDGRWLVDQVQGEPGVRYRVWDDGELAAEIAGDLDALAGWLAGVGVDLGELEPVPQDWDPFCE